jgi:uncharacterized DUF497 family protein
MEFEWDERKNRENQRNHKIRFEEAKLIFDGVHFTQVDPRDYWDEHGNLEIREITIGSLRGGRVLVICHTERNGKTRIISARKAKPLERKRYYAAFRKAPQGN